MTKLVSIYQIEIHIKWPSNSPSLQMLGGVGCCT